MDLIERLQDLPVTYPNTTAKMLLERISKKSLTIYEFSAEDAEYIKAMSTFLDQVALEHEMDAPGIKVTESRMILDRSAAKREHQINMIVAGAKSISQFDATKPSWKFII